ncbi:MAG: mandelate racemase/muconate lactonizing protein [Chloroflexota bacterium]|nr:mandelate racemase/muconate lactonizing protein [Chloroflexota bacterium]
MKITAVRCIQYTGTMDFPGVFWEERLIRPVDIYPQFKNEGAGWLPPATEGAYRMTSTFVHIETDAGMTGIGGPITPDQAFIIKQSMEHYLLGADPLAIERLWDVLYRAAVHGRKGVEMMAISAIDCALWDLKGKWANVPVYVLLGGPVRETLPAYASALGYGLDPDRAATVTKEIVSKGFTATKWFPRWGPADGRAGIAKNVELMRTLREAAGPDVDIMIDAWMSWDVPYTLAMAERFAEYQPRWIEEPVLPDKIASYASITAKIGHGIAVSGAEHEYTRWGIHQLMQANAMHVYQPDIYWAGGISELLKIAALASVYDVQLIPHGHSTPATANFLYAQPVTLCPMLEYLIKWNTIHQWFLKNPVEPQNGFIPLPTLPGIGMELDDAKIESQKELP